MNYRLKIILSVLVILLLAISSSYVVPLSSDTIELKEANGIYEITVPSSELILTLPKNKLVQSKHMFGGGIEDPKYIYLRDTTQLLSISCWFKLKEKYSGIKNLWEKQTTQWNRSELLKPENVSFIQIGSWDAVIFDMKIINANNSHIFAHGVQGGTWIKLHISMTAKRPAAEIREQLQSKLKSMEIKHKS